MSGVVGNIGYFAIGAETAGKGIAATPGRPVPLYKDSLSTDIQLQDLTPIAGMKYKRFDVVTGQRTHKGDMTIMAEANSSANLLDMLLTLGAPTGTGPYTRVANLTASNPRSATIDIGTGSIVKRFCGAEISKLAPTFKDNEMRWNISVSALYSYQGREIASVAGNVITLKTDYDVNPTRGLVAGDLLRGIRAADNSFVDTTLTSITMTTVTVANAGTLAAGDMLHIRPVTAPLFNLLPVFLWSKTFFCFGATAALALAASQLRVDQGSEWGLMHDFNKDDGEMRSGANDPDSLERKLGDASLKIKKVFDFSNGQALNDIKNYNAVNKSACVIRHFAGPANQYEFRVIMNNLKTDGKPVPELDSENLEYSELDFHPVYDQTDGQAWSVLLINNLATV